MIITKIRLEEENPMTKTSIPPISYPIPAIDLNLDSTAGQNGYILKGVVGLEPTDLVQVVDGFDINGVPAIEDVADSRQIVLKIGLSPIIAHTYSTLRDALYRLVGRTLIVKLMDGAIVVAQAVGYIRRPEAVHFTNRPEVQLTIDCERGEFMAPEAIDIPTSLLGQSRPVIPYQEGSAPAGLELQFTMTATKANVNFLKHHMVRRMFGVQPFNKFQATYSILVDDVITINTHPGLRQITLLRGATLIDLAGFLNAGAVWPKLFPGVNTWEWNLNGGVTWNYARYTPRFWGV